LDNWQFETLTEAARQQVVIDFILNNQGCTAQDIIDGQDVSGRGKVFDILEVLKKDGVVTSQVSIKDKRDTLLFVSLNNPIVTVTRELNLIESFLDTILADLNSNLLEILPNNEGRDAKGRYHEIDAYENAIYHLVIPIQITLNLIDQIYRNKSFFWSSKIKDPESLDRLHMGSFMRIRHFQRKFLSIIEEDLRKHSDLKEAALISICNYPPQTFGECVTSVYQYGRLNIMKKLLKYLSKVSGEDHGLLHPKRKVKQKIYTVP